MTSRAWTALKTPVGPISVACSESGVTGVWFGVPPPDSAGPAGLQAATELAVAARLQLGEYFSGQRRTFDLALDWSAASRLQRCVLGVLFDSVAFGETVTYGVLARRAGARAAGAALPARAIARSWDPTRTR